MIRPLAGGPWSLVRRLSALVLAVGLVSLAIQFVVLRLWTAPLFDEHAQALASQVRTVHAALRASAPAQRRALADALSRGTVRLTRELPEDLLGAAAEPEGALPRRPGEPAASAPPTREPLRTPFALRLAGVLGAVKLHDGAGGRLLFELPVDGERWWLTLQAPESPQVLADTALLWLGLLGLATLLATVAGLRWIARPVRELARQLDAQRGALRPLVSDPQASTEIRALVDAFNGLAHANAMAASLRQQLLAGVSHDLRTPLTRLRLRIETQCEPPLSDALEADLLALQRIVDQFLAYVQGDTGMRLGPPRPVRALMADIAAAYVAQGHAVAVVAAPEGAGASPELPELALRRLIENLVNNAIAHGQPPVLLSLQAEGADWLLSVSDAGPGMSAAEFARARQPFVRLVDTRAELGHCGLGLAIVDQIAQQIDATLSVRPRGEESAFSVLLRWPRTLSSAT